MHKETAIRTALIAAAYVASGWVGLQLALPPGYATGIWLPSGIALAAVLVWGQGALAGVFLGAFLLNAFHAASGQWAVPDAAQAGVAALVALGSTLQALVVARLLATREPQPLRFDELGPVLRFALLWSPLGCLIGASCGVGVLLVAGTVPSADGGANWLTWWFGDWMGMVIAAPAVLALLGGGYMPGWPGRRLVVAVAGFACFAFVTALHFLALVQERARVEAGFEAFAVAMALRVERALDEGRQVPCSPLGPSGADGAGARPAASIAAAVGALEAGRVALRVSELTGTGAVELYRRDLEGRAAHGERLVFSRSFVADGRSFGIEAEAGADYVRGHTSPVPRIVQLAGLLVTAMLVCFVLVLSGRSARVHQLVAERTAELDERNRRLSAEMDERQVVEERLREAQRNFLDSLAFAQIGAWELEPLSGIVSGTQEVCRVFGLTEPVFGMDLPGFTSLVHPADRERLSGALRHGLEGDAVLAIDCRIVRRDGQQRWITMRARRRIEADDRVRLLGVLWDTTELVAANERTRLLASAFEQGGEAIFIADADLGILEVNPAFHVLTGLDGKDVVGREIHDLFAQRSTREQFRALVAAARERGTWQGEVWARTADGAGAPCWLVLATVRDARGQITHHIGSFVDTSERKHAEERIEFLAHHDALTGLPNRFALRGRLEQALAQAARERTRLAVLFIDMDRFKDINDSLGHEVGDLLLLEIAGRLRGCVRASDVVARLGGDEFVVVLSAVADEAAAAHMAAKLRQELGTPYPVRGRILHSSPSIGISLYPEHGDSVDVLMRNADAAMYRAKDSGRNNYQFFDVSLSERARERIELAADLRVALEQGAFLLHFQPQMRASDGRFVAAEALIRWPHPVRGMVPPDKFIGIAEEFGLIDAIGDWALNQACRELAALNARGVQGFRVCVNLSPKQLHDRELPAKVAAAITAAGIAATDLELELTESVAMQDPQSTIQLLNRLYESGVGLAIDDFGTGYSSLAYLKMLPLHNLKLDRSFVRDIEADPSDRAICSATVALAHALGIRVVAEGVETEAQRDFLLALGCDFLQGWLFSKPLPADGLARLLGAPEHG